MKKLKLISMMCILLVALSACGEDDEIRRRPVTESQTQQETDNSDESITSEETEPSQETQKPGETSDSEGNLDENLSAKESTEESAENTGSEDASSENANAEDTDSDNAGSENTGSENTNPENTGSEENNIDNSTTADSNTAQPEVEVIPCDPITLVTSSRVNLREKPTTDSKALKTLGRGQSVQVIGTVETDGDISKWAKVVYKGVEGYVSAEFLAEKTASTQESQNATENTTDNPGV